MLEVKNIKKSTLEGKKILKGINFNVEKGEFVGILGASGAGKTLTMRCISGLTTPTSGEVNLIDRKGNNINITNCKGRKLRIVRQKIGNIFQGHNLVKRLNVLENVMIGRLGSINVMRSLLYGFTDEEAKEAIQTLERVNIAHLAHRVTGSLSGGEMQRVAIARALFQKPILMLADEPIASLDPQNANKIMKLLKSLAEEMPILGIFHQPEITAKYCTRIIAIKEGEIVYNEADKNGHKRLFNQLPEIYGAELEEIEQAKKMSDNPTDQFEGRPEILTF